MRRGVHDAGGGRELLQPLPAAGGAGVLGEGRGCRHRQDKAEGKRPKAKLRALRHRSTDARDYSTPGCTTMLRMLHAPSDLTFARVRRLLTAATAVLTAAVLCACSSQSPSSSPSPTPASGPAPPAFSAFVDEFLDQFASHHPSIAAGNGLHQYDERLEDFSAQSIADEISRLKAAAQSGWAPSPSMALTPDERVDHRIVGGLIDAWLLELDVNRNWQRNLMVYALGGVRRRAQPDDDGVVAGRGAGTPHHREAEGCAGAARRRPARTSPIRRR